MSKSNLNLNKILLPPMLIIILTLILGFTSNFIFHKEFRIFTIYQPAPEEELMEFEEIDLHFLIDLLNNDMSILIDARAGDLFIQSHIPGAISLPVYEFDQIFPQIKAQIPFDKTIITYCIDKDCVDSKLLANKLYNAGYKYLFIYKEGMEGWDQYNRSVTEK